MEQMKVNPQLLNRALEIAGGDRSRLEIERDGSVTVHNNPIRGQSRPRSAKRSRRR